MGSFPALRKQGAAHIGSKASHSPSARDAQALMQGRAGCPPATHGYLSHSPLLETQNPNYGRPTWWHRAL